MPLYHYHCSKCNCDVFENFSIKEVDKKVVKCDGCKKKMKRMIGNPRFSFKGGSPTKSRCPE